MVMLMTTNVGGAIVPDKPEKYRDPRLNYSQEIPPEAVGGSIFHCFFAIISDRK